MISVLVESLSGLSVYQVLKYTGKSVKKKWNLPVKLVKPLLLLIGGLQQDAMLKCY